MPECIAGGAVADAHVSRLETGLCTERRGFWVEAALQAKQIPLDSINNPWATGRRMILCAEALSSIPHRRVHVSKLAFAPLYIRFRTAPNHRSVTGGHGLTKVAGSTLQRLFAVFNVRYRSDSHMFSSPFHDLQYSSSSLSCQQGTVPLGLQLTITSKIWFSASRFSSALSSIFSSSASYVWTDGNSAAPHSFSFAVSGFGSMSAAAAADSMSQRGGDSGWERRRREEMSQRRRRAVTDPIPDSFCMFVV